MGTATIEQRMYWYDAGASDAANGKEEPDYGRMNAKEELCWWTGFYARKANIPRPTDVPLADL
jgi:hypothetical protein